MSQWPDNCDMSKWEVITNILDFNFIHGDIHGRSCKKAIQPAFNEDEITSVTRNNYMEQYWLFFCRKAPVDIGKVSKAVKNAHQSILNTSATWQPSTWRMYTLKEPVWQVSSEMFLTSTRKPECFNGSRRLKHGPLEWSQISIEQNPGDLILSLIQVQTVTFRCTTSYTQRTCLGALETTLALIISS